MSWARASFAMVEPAEAKKAGGWNSCLLISPWAKLDCSATPGNIVMIKKFKNAGNKRCLTFTRQFPCVHPDCLHVILPNQGQNQSKAAVYEALQRHGFSRKLTWRIAIHKAWGWHFKAFRCRLWEINAVNVNTVRSAMLLLSLAATSGSRDPAALNIGCCAHGHSTVHKTKHLNASDADPCLLNL